MQVKRNQSEDNRWLVCAVLVFLSIFVFILVSPVSAEKAQTNKEPTFTYDAKVLPDPFKPLIAPTKKPVRKKKIKKRTAPLTPLEKFGIEQLKLVGITFGKGKKFAMIEDPEGKFYTVLRGMYMGTNGGKVAQILYDRVIVEEEEEDSLGTIHKNRIELKLFSESGGE